MEPLDADKDPRVLGPFELLARLGAGGMGVAYLARRIPLDDPADELAAMYRLAEPDEAVDAAEPRLAVVKTIQQHLLDQPGARERFAREIDSVRAVVSDRVPALRAADTEATEPWFAMDFVHGPPLSTLVEGAGVLPVGPYAALGLHLVDALRAIHGTGLLHRDLKPDNVVLGPDGPVVLDFGLATLIERRTSQMVTGPGEAWGTKRYMSYEQLRDFRRTREPTDVYGLGATLFFASTGRAPYAHEPLLTPPDWQGVDAALRPLLAQILVPAPERRPDLDGVEMGLRAILHEAALTEERAFEELRVWVREAALAPELPPEALSGRVDPAVRERAQRAVDEGDAPDRPWAGAAGGHDPESPWGGSAGFFGIVDAEEPEPVEPDAPRPGTPPGYTPTVVDEPAAEPARPAAPPEPPPDAAPTSYPLPAPRPTEEPPPGVPRTVRRVAERLRKTYAHSRKL
ncbi:serine/threonine protein kinase [Streptomyces sp. LE64]|uniref:serine/threonine protein kinase n=1 Tax=Streptomyces sp. LE64 TaxID=3448653 RepID=UPI0040412701